MRTVNENHFKHPPFPHTATFPQNLSALKNLVSKSESDQTEEIFTKQDLIKNISVFDQAGPSLGLICAVTLFLFNSRQIQ